MKTEPRRFRTKVLQSTCWTLITAAALLPISARPDGCFVVPKFVWDKQKDINEPTQKAIIAYDAGREDLILQVKYEGPVEEFGWLIPVPGLPTVKEGSMECFYELSKYTQQLWEPPMPQSRGRDRGLSAANLPGAKPEPVKVIEIKTVGAYEVAVLSAENVGALENWLDANQFSFPQGKADVIESYIKQRWYFAAAKINLSRTSGFALIPWPSKTQEGAKASLEEKLSSGELRPLHLAFASDECVFPLKISSVNGKPSEVQVYVLSKEPFLEKAMFERKLPGIYSNDVVDAQRTADSFERQSLFALRLGNGNTNLQLSSESKNEVRKRRETLRVTGGLPRYVKVTNKELPNCSKEIPRLAENRWWLTKETWIFQPKDMRDLEFEPAIPVLADKLGSQYGYYAAAFLGQFGSDAIWPLLEGLRGSNAAVRSAIISAFEYDHAEEIRDDATFQVAARELINSHDPEIRAFVVSYVGGDPEFLLAAMHDEDFKVAGIAGGNLMQTLMYRPEGKKYIPAVLEMLKDTNSATQAAAIEALRGVQVKIPRADLLQFFSYPNLHVVWTAYTKLGEEGEDISNEDTRPLLQNHDPSVRLIGLKTLAANQEKSSVELALPLLKDPEGVVAFRAAGVLRSLTGQHFTEQQADQWEKWWSENKETFVVESHPEELQPSKSNMLQTLKSLSERQITNSSH